MYKSKLYYGNWPKKCAIYKDAYIASDKYFCLWKKEIFYILLVWAKTPSRFSEKYLAR